jgi:hypothetical protein
VRLKGSLQILLLTPSPTLNLCALLGAAIPNLIVRCCAISLGLLNSVGNYAGGYFMSGDCMGGVVRPINGLLQLIGQHVELPKQLL